MFTKLSVAIVALLSVANVATVAAVETMPIRVVMHQDANVARIERHLETSSDPHHKAYGQHLSAAHLAKLARVTPACEKHTLQWLESLGADRIRIDDAHGDVVSATLDAVVAHRLIRGNIDDQLTSSHGAPECVTLVLPAHTTHTTEVTMPSAAFRSQEQQQQKHQQQQQQQMSADGLASPPVQKTGYGVPANLRCTDSKTTQMVWGPGSYGYSTSDLAQFYEAFHMDPSNVHNVNTTDFKGTPGGDNFGEGSLDVQQISSMALGCKTLVSNTNTSKSTEETYGFGYAFLDFLIEIAGRPSVPGVLSFSLGSLSFKSCDILCSETARRTAGTSTPVSVKHCKAYMETQRQVCMFDSAKQMAAMSVQLMKLGARGVTVLAAAGDGGSHYSFTPFNTSPVCPSCASVLNTVSCDLNFPTFPSASPYCLAVGGTQYGSGGPSAPDYWPAGGAGFAWQFARPSYQDSAVKSYLAAGTEPSTAGSVGVSANSNVLQRMLSKQRQGPAQFNAKGRAYPDLSAVANNVPIVNGGRLSAAGGTSAAAPALAGVISLINDARAKAGLKTLGFLNPRLYAAVAAHPNELTYDITQGNTHCNAGSIMGIGCCSTGFASAAGFDAVTGLGSPLFPGLLKYLGQDDEL